MEWKGPGTTPGPLTAGLLHVGPRVYRRATLSVGMAAFASAASAQSWPPPALQEIWKLEEQHMVAREDSKTERSTVTGHYTDVSVMENGRWLFVAWEGGDDPKE